MNDGDRLRQILETAQPAAPSRRGKHVPEPPSIELGADGTGTAVVTVADPKHVADEVAAIGEKMGLPVQFLDITKVKAYGKPDDPQYSVHTNVRRITADNPSFDALVERVRGRRPRKPRTVPPADRTLVAAVADPQVGKGPVGPLLDVWDAAIGHIEDRHRDLRRLKRPANRLFVAGTGDTTEGCGGDPNYVGQDRMVTLNESQQIEVASDMLDRALDAWSLKFDEVLTTTVSSNHDAKRRGKDYPMGREDCRAFTIWRGLARAYAKAPDRYGHVTFWLPDDPDVAVVDLHGHGLAAIHGDWTGASAKNVRAGMEAWWKGQQFGGLPAGDCSILLTAHFHHYWSARQTGRWLFGAPALDTAGSKWLTDRTGTWSSPAILTFVVDADGVSDVHVQELE